MIGIALMLKIALRARRAKRAVSGTGIIGLKGKAVTPVAPEGTVFVRNELWRARAHQAIGEGESVLVTGLDGITLKVRSAGNRLATKVRSN
ncbi:MAG TPA: NfeD family protein [Blastocatellia bacterium]|nr:NfeD family protein [Blastocatellia bacterium]